MQLMQNFLLRLNVFPPFNGLMERRLAIYTTRTLSKPLHPRVSVSPIISLFSITVNYMKPSPIQVYSLLLAYSTYLNLTILPIQGFFYPCLQRIYYLLS